MILYGYMAVISIDAELVCLECNGFNEKGKLVITGGRQLSPVTTEGLLRQGIFHGVDTKHMRFNLTVGGETNIAVLDWGGGMSGIAPIVLEDGKVTL